MPSYDNSIRQVPMLSPPDSHGHAALLLVESLIHGLCEKSTLTVGEAIEITERAIDVQRDHAEAADETAASMWQSHRLLLSIATSLSLDVENPPCTLA
ncbi:MAG: hypothetical protein V4618_15970 [Pseudomonadota bacterium]